MTPTRRAILKLGLLGLFTASLALPVAAQGNATNDPKNILFTSQDKVTRFDLPL